MMLSTMSGHFTTGTRYSLDQIQTFSQHGYNTIGKAFLYSAITENLKSLVPGKESLTLHVELEDGVMLQLSAEQEQLMGLTYKKKW